MKRGESDHAGEFERTAKTHSGVLISPLFASQGGERIPAFAGMNRAEGVFLRHRRPRFLPSNKVDTSSRRRFLQFLAGSPLLAYAGMAATSATGSELATPAEALNVFDLEEIARKNLPPAHFGYLATGVGDEETLRANREGFSKFKIRSRRLVDTRQIDMRIQLFGAEWPTPILLAPVASQRAFHEDGELAMARQRRRATTCSSCRPTPPFPSKR